MVQKLRKTAIKFYQWVLNKAYSNPLNKQTIIVL